MKVSHWMKQRWQYTVYWFHTKWSIVCILNIASTACFNWKNTNARQRNARRLNIFPVMLNLFWRERIITRNPEGLSPIGFGSYLHLIVLCAGDCIAALVWMRYEKKCGGLIPQYNNINSHYMKEVIVKSNWKHWKKNADKSV